MSVSSNLGDPKEEESSLCNSGPIDNSRSVLWVSHVGLWVRQDRARVPDNVYLMLYQMLLRRSMECSMVPYVF